MAKAAKKKTPAKKAAPKKKTVAKKAAPKKKTTAVSRPPAAKKASAVKKAPPAKKAAAVKKAPAAKSPAGGKSSSRKKGLLSAKELQVRLNELLETTPTDAELFHECCLLIKNTIGSSFINFYTHDGPGGLRLIAAHERDLSFYVTLAEEKDQPELRVDLEKVAPRIGESPVTAASPDNLPLYGIDENRLAYLDEIRANSALIFPFTMPDGTLLGAVTVAVQEPQPPYTEGDLDAALPAARPLQTILLRRVLHSSQTLVRSMEKAKAGELREIQAELAQARSQAEEARTEHENALIARDTAHAGILTQTKESAASELETLRREQEEKNRALQESHQRDLEEKVSESQAKVVAATREKNEISERIRGEQEQAQQSLRETIENNKADHEERIRSLTQEHTAELERARREFQEREAELKQASSQGDQIREKALAEQASHHEKQLTELKEKQQNEVRETEERNQTRVKELQEYQQLAESEIQESSEKFSQEKREAVGVVKAEFERLVTELKEKRDRARRELEEFKGRAEKEAGETHRRLTAEREEALKKEREEHERALNKLRTAHGQSLENRGRESEQAESTLRARHADGLKELNQKHENELLQAMESQEEETKKRDTTIQELRGKLEEATAGQARLAAGADEKNKEFEQEIARLREVHQTKTSGLKEEHTSALENLRREEQDKKNQLEKKLGVEIGALRTTLEEERKSARTSAGDMGGRINELQDQLEKSRNADTEKGKQLESNARELTDLKTRLTDANTGFAAREKDYRTQIEDWTEKFNSKKTQRDREKQDNEAKIAKLSTDLSESLKMVEEYKNSLEESRNGFARQTAAAEEKVNELKALLEKERVEAADTQKRLRSETESAGKLLQQKETDFLGRIHALNESLNSRTKELERMSTHLPELEEQARDLTSRHENEKQRADNLQSRLDNLTREKGGLEEKIERLEREFGAERKRLQDEYRKKEEELQDELKLGEDVQAETSEKLKNVENRNVSIQRELDAARDRGENLESQLDQARSMEKELRGDIAGHVKAEGDLKSEMGRLNTRLNETIANLEKARETERELKNQIGIHRERETRLEQAIASMEEEKHRLKTDLAAMGEEIEKLKTASGHDQESLAALKYEVAEAQIRDKKLTEELSASRVRELGSRETGNLIAELTSAISNISGLPDKLAFIRENMNLGVPLHRIALYSILDEEHIKFENGFWGEASLGALNSLRIPMRETVFGQCIASGKTSILHAAPRLTDPDLPVPLLKGVMAETGNEPDAMKTFVFVPLREADGVIGLLTVAVESAAEPPEERVVLLNQVSPLIAAALRFEQNQEELGRYRKARKYSDQVNSYLERRFLLSTRRIGKVAKELAPRDPESPEEKEKKRLAKGIVAETQSFSSLPIPGTSENGRSPEEFDQWLAALGKRAGDSMGVSFQLNMKPGVGESLHKRLGRSFRNLFWVAEEAVENVIQHSQAKSLAIGLDRADEQIQFTITDDGEGLVRTAGTDDPRKGTGLKAIRNLAGNTGGRVEFARDDNGYGFRLKLIWDARYKESSL